MSKQSVPDPHGHPASPTGGDQSLSDWMHLLRGGSASAAAALWARLEPRLLGLARRRLAGLSPAQYDEEDLAVSALNALCDGAREGRFAQLESRDDLWRLLQVIVSRKATNRRRYAARRPEVGGSAVHSGIGAVAATDLPELEDGEWAELLTVDCRELLERLEPKLRDVALLKFRGHTNDEIAARLDRAPRSVERYVERIRAEWADLT